MVRPKSPALKIVQVPIDDLKTASYNPRACTSEEEKHIEDSLRTYDQVDPLIVNNALRRKNVLIGGHQRLRIMKKMGYKTVAVVYVTISSLKKEKELNLRLNRNTGHWDWDKLRSLFDIDLLEDVGFDDNDLTHIFDDALETEDDGFNAEKELAKIKKPKTKPGDVVQLSMHKLICADSTDLPSVKKLAGKRKVDMIYCDPPFNINLDYDRGVGGAKQYGGHTNDRKSKDGYRSFLKTTIENALVVSNPDCHCFYYCDESGIGLLQKLYEECGIDTKRVCLWIKNNFNMTPCIAFNKCYEPCVYGTRGKPYLSLKRQNFTEVLNKEIEQGNRMHDDILDLLNIWLVKREASSEYEHPTQKPPTLHEKALRRCTKPGDTVLDLFGGSGSTLIACEQMKRKALLCEVEPIFCDLIIRRFESLTGKHAKKLL